MAASTVADAGEKDLARLRSESLEFDAVVLFTAEPPITEDFFTVVPRRLMAKLPVGVIEDAQMTDEARKSEHLIQYKGQGSRTPKTSSSSGFCRVEKGKMINQRNP